MTWNREKRIWVHLRLNLEFHATCCNNISNETLLSFVEPERWQRLMGCIFHLRSPSFILFKEINRNVPSPITLQDYHCLNWFSKTSPYFHLKDSRYFVRKKNEPEGLKYTGFTCEDHIFLLSKSVLLTKIFAIVSTLPLVTRTKHLTSSIAARWKFKKLM